MSKFKKRGGSKGQRKAAESLAEDEEDISAFEAAAPLQKKRIKQDPAVLAVNPAAGARQADTEEEKWQSRSKEDLRRFYEGEKDYSKKSSLPEVATEGPITMKSERVSDGGDIQPSSAGDINVPFEAAPAEVEEVYVLSLDEMISEVKHARDTLSHSCTDLENSKMRLESERERLLESAPELREEEEGEGEGNLASRTKALTAFRAYCAELVGMLREKDAAIAETRALIMASVTAGTYVSAHDFATSIMRDVREDLSQFEAVLKAFSVFRATAKPLKQTQLERISAHFDGKRVVGNINDNLYKTAFVSLSLPELLHPLITIDLISAPLLLSSEFISVHTDVNIGVERGREALSLAGRPWLTGLCHYVQEAPLDGEADPDCDDTLILRVLLRSVLPFLADTVAAVAAMEPARRDAMQPQIRSALPPLVAELGQQLESVRLGPCEATERYKMAVSSLLDSVEAHEGLDVAVAPLRGALFKSPRSPNGAPVAH